MDPHEYLKSLAAADDAQIDIARAALALAAHHEGTRSLERYERHLKKLTEDVAACCTRFSEGRQADALLQWRALKQILAGTYDYEGDTENYSDLRNASFIQLIERRKGLPVTLAILYIHVGRALEWDVEGLDFPGHFLCRLQKDGQRLIFDPFNGAAILEAPDLRALLKKLKGAHAELSASYFQPAENRAILLRLQNNMKHRYIETEDYVNALGVVEAMRVIAPEEYRLLLDAGILYARTDRPKAAIETLENYIESVPPGRDRQEAERLLEDIRRNMH